MSLLKEYFDKKQAHSIFFVTSVISLVLFWFLSSLIIDRVFSQWFSFSQKELFTIKLFVFGGMSLLTTIFFLIKPLFELRKENKNQDK